MKFSGIIKRAMRNIAVAVCLLHSHAMLEGKSILLAHLTDLNGLPQNSIKSLYRGPLGYLWLGTENGLVRYDGRHMIIYTAKGFSSNRFSYIIPGKMPLELYAISSENEILIISNGKIAQKTRDSVVKERFCLSRRHHSMLSINQLYTDSNGRLSILGNLISDRSAVTYNGKHLSKLSTEYCSQIFAFEKRLYTLNSDFSIREITPGESPLHLQSGKILPVFPKLAGIDPIPVFKYKNSIYQIHKVNGHLQVTEIVQDLPENIHINVALYDQKEQTLFLGTASNGLYIYKINPGIRSPLFSKNKSYAAQLTIDSNTVLAGGVLIRNKTHSILPKLYGKTYVYTILKDHFGHYYVPMSGGGIYRIRSLNPAETPERVFDINSPVFLFEDSAYRIWTGSTKAGLSIYDNRRIGRKKLLRNFPDMQKLGGNVVYLKQQNRYCIANGGMLYFLSQNLSIEDSFAVNKNANIRHLFEDQNGTLWLLTYGDGIFGIRHGKLFSLPPDKNRHLNIAHCMIQDRQGNYWVSTNKGLFKIRYREMADFLSSKHKATPTYIYYSTQDGLITNEFNGGCFPCAVELGNGYYSFPTISGLFWINPDRIREPKLNSGIQIDHIRADNQNYTIRDTIEFSRDISRLSIHLSFAYWGNLENTELKYKLHGTDKDWTVLNSPYTITYSNLKGGPNLLSIQLTDLLHPDNTKTKNICFVVPIKFYMKWWFYGLCLAGIALLTYTIAQLRTRAMRKKNIQLQRLVKARTSELDIQNRSIRDHLDLLLKKQEELMDVISVKDKAMSAFSHNVIGPLKFISVLTDSMRKGHTQADKHSIDTLDQTSQSLLKHSLELLDWVKQQSKKQHLTMETIHLRDFVSERTKLFLQMAKTRHTRFRNQIPQDLQIETSPQLLGIVLYNLLDNAVKNTAYGIISMEAGRHENHIQMVFRDNGKGMSPEICESINALSNPANQLLQRQKPETVSGIGWVLIADCLAQLQGRFDVKSKINLGTEIRIELPVNNPSL